jgi:nitrile hydratase
MDQPAAGDAMSNFAHPASDRLDGIVLATGEAPLFRPGEPVRVMTRAPVGHYRVPTYLRGKAGVVESVIEPAAIDNEEEACGRNAGSKRHYYRIVVPMTSLWAHYAGSPAFGDRTGDGRAISFDAIDVYVIHDGRIATNWHREDYVTLLRQLGVVSPGPRFKCALQGCLLVLQLN